MKKQLFLLLAAGFAITQMSIASDSDNDAIKAELNENISRFKSARDEDIGYASIFFLATLVGIKQLVCDSPPSIFSFFTPIWAGTSIFGIVMANQFNNRYKEAVKKLDEIETNEKTAQ